MKLVICSKDVDNTLIAGDLISWHEDNANTGKHVGLHNALASSGYANSANYLDKTPFLIITFPLITYEDIRPILEEMVYLDAMMIPIDDIAAYEAAIYDPGVQTYTSERKWKIDISNLESRQANTFYSPQDIAAEKTKWLQVLEPPIRRDTVNAYHEATLPTTVISDILVLR